MSPVIQRSSHWTSRSKRLLTNESYEDLRKMLAVQRHLSSAVDLGVAFEGVDNDAAILISDKCSDAKAVTMLGSRSHKTSLTFHSIPSSTFKAMPFYIIPINSEAVRSRLPRRLPPVTSSFWETWLK